MKNFMCKLKQGVYDLNQLNTIKQDENVLNKYREGLKPELVQALDHIDIYINKALFSKDKMQGCKLGPDVYSLTLYSSQVDMSVKALAKRARDCGYTVEVDRNRKYDKRRYHTCLVLI